MRAFVAAFLFSAGLAAACSCVQPGPSVTQAKDSSDVVFRGTIVALRDADKPAALAYAGRDTKKVVLFKVTHVWKGDVGSTFEMPGLQETSMCVGFRAAFLKVGSDLLVYAARARNSPEYYTNDCTRTAFAKDAGDDLDQLRAAEGPKKQNDR